jgi:hypothetical protein
MALDWNNVKQLNPPIQTTGEDVILSGHGALVGGGATVVPAGVEFWVLAPPGASIADETGQALENTLKLTQLGIKNPHSEILVNNTPNFYKTGAEVPDYTLYPPRGIVIDPNGPHVIGVEKETLLSELWERVQPFIKPGKTIRVYWAACTAMAGAKNPVVIGR